MSSTLLAVFAVSVLGSVALWIYSLGALIAGRRRPQQLHVWVPPLRRAAVTPPPPLAAQIVALPGLPPISTWGSKATGTPPIARMAKGSIAPPMRPVAYVPPVRRAFRMDDDFVNDAAASSCLPDDEFLDESPTQLDPRFLIVRSTRRS